MSSVSMKFQLSYEDNVRYVASTVAFRYEALVMVTKVSAEEQEWDRGKGRSVFDTLSGSR